MGVAPHVINHASDAQIAGLGTAHDEANIYNIIFSTNTNIARANIHALINSNLAGIIGSLHIHATANAICACIIIKYIGNKGPFTNQISILLNHLGIELNGFVIAAYNTSIGSNIYLSIIS